MSKITILKMKKNEQKNRCLIVNCLKLKIKEYRDILFLCI